MIKDKDCTIFLTLAGSTSAAGCMHIYRDLVKYNMVDAIVATGASIIDMDFFEALGFKHYQGSQFQDDDELRKNYKDRNILEKLTITAELCQLTRQNSDGKHQSWECNRYWTKVSLHESGGPVPNYITLSGSGRVVE